MNPGIHFFPALANLFFPHVCCGCRTGLLEEKNIFCIYCLAAMPLTGFEQCAGNPSEKRFWAGAAIQSASAHYYFTKNSPGQQSLQRFKYIGTKEIGSY